MTCKSSHSMRVQKSLISKVPFEGRPNAQAYEWILMLPSCAKKHDRRVEKLYAIRGVKARSTDLKSEVKIRLVFREKFRKPFLPIRRFFLRESSFSYLNWSLHPLSLHVAFLKHERRQEIIRNSYPPIILNFEIFTAPPLKRKSALESAIKRKMSGRILKTYGTHLPLENISIRTLTVIHPPRQRLNLDATACDASIRCVTFVHEVTGYTCGTVCIFVFWSALPISPMEAGSVQTQVSPFVKMKQCQQGTWAETDVFALPHPLS